MASKDSAGRARLSGEQRRAQIAAAAERIAREQGLGAVTLRAVAASVGVGPALVAHHAPSMDDVVAGAFDTIVAAELRDLVLIADRASRAVRDAGDGRTPASNTDADSGAAAALAAVLATLLDGSRADVTLVWVQSWALGGRNAALAERVRAQMDAWTRFLAGIVRSGVASGCFRVTDPEAVAAQLLGMIDGLNAHALVSWRDADERSRLMALSAGAMLGIDAETLLTGDAALPHP
ncbi:TetR family transcriptional regulator C-terminal domain-containing protein [Microbacterium arborescens]